MKTKCSAWQAASAKTKRNATGGQTFKNGSGRAWIRCGPPTQIWCMIQHKKRKAGLSMLLLPELLKASLHSQFPRCFTFASHDQIAQKFLSPKRRETSSTLCKISICTTSTNFNERQWPRHGLYHVNPSGKWQLRVIHSKGGSSDKKRRASQILQKLSDVDMSARNGSHYSIFKYRARTLTTSLSSPSPLCST